MGAADYHLHHFEIKAKGKIKTVKIGIPDFEGISEEDIYPGWEIPIHHYFNDLGVEAESRDQGAKYPRCVDGARACPPEDCGGESGYERMLDIL